MCDEKIPIAIQLYSLRDVIGNDIPGTLQALADMGYAGVEFAGTYGLPSTALRDMLDNAGLTCAGAHVPLAALEGDACEETIATYRTLGTERLIIPYADMAKLDDVLPRMQAIARTAEDHGVCVGFHNHKAEFEQNNGLSHFDRIFQEMPESFLLQLDIGWAAAAGQDVAAIIRRYAQRIQTVHVKEFDPEDPTAVVGEGRVDWPATLSLLKEQTPIAWFVVEQEQYRVDAMDSARGCIRNLKKMGW